MNIKDNLIILENEHIKIELSAYGATLYKVFMKNKNGEYKNILLAYDDADEFTKSHEVNPYFGMTIGRHAGRIRNAEFELNGEVYKLEKNDGNNNLHGGYSGVSNTMWDSIVDGNVCKFELNSYHLEGGFPGEVDIRVTYSLEGNTLKIQFEGETDRDTLLNLTNHAYFNLSNDKTEIYNHKLFVDSKQYCKVDDEGIVAEVVNSVDTPFDFNSLTHIGNLSKSGVEYDNPFMLLKENDDLILFDETSGRKVTINSTYPAVVLYSFNYPNSELVNGGVVPKQHMALAIEPQYVPNGINDDRFECPITTVNKPYSESITYKFEVVE